jgi:hypothetical protein
MKVDATTSAIASGEAVVNDAVSIVVFESVLSLFYTHSNSHIVDFGSVPAQFAVVFFGSIFIGVAGGLVSALLTKHLPLNVYFISAAAERPELMYSTASVVYGTSASSPSSDKDADRDESHDSRMYLEVGFARFPAALKPLLLLNYCLAAPPRAVLQRA